MDEVVSKASNYQQSIPEGRGTHFTSRKTLSSPLLSLFFVFVLSAPLCG